VTFLDDGLDLLLSPLVHERVTRMTAHRPWSQPRRSWVMAQTWTDLLFAHWSVDPQLLRAVVPAQLPLDTFDGRAWIGVTPFGVRNLRLRPTLPVPFLSAFPEINVRTYVTIEGKPGIYFFSLDTDSAPAVAAARHAYRLPYFRARMSIDRGAEEIRFASTRTNSDTPARADFCASYRPGGDIFYAARGSLEHWLTGRYCLYTFDRALLHYAGRQDVVFWTLKQCSDAAAQAGPRRR
jgi:uncharacterized protein YqjF (DUF2071 family)